MADKLDLKLSGEALAQFNRNVSELESLDARRLEIIDKVIAGEKDVGNARIAYLKEYLDLYSKNLDDIIARKSSKLSDAFLILERQAMESLATATKEAEKAEKRAQRARNAANSASGGGGNNNRNKGRNVNQTVSDSNRAGLRDDTPQDGDSDGKKYADKMAKFFQKNEEERSRTIASTGIEELNARRSEQLKQLQNHSKQMAEIDQAILDLEISRNRDEKEKTAALTSIRLTNLQESIKAESDAQSFINQLIDKQSYSEKYEDEAAENRSRTVNAETKLKEAQAFEEAIAKERAKKELYYKRKNNGILEKEDAKRIEEELKKKYSFQERNEKSLSKQRERLAQIELEQSNKAEINKLREGVGAFAGKGKSLTERQEALYSLTHDEATGAVDIGKAMSAAVTAVSDLATQLESKIDEIASYKGAIDTRLQGSNNKRSSGSYWDQLVKDMTSVGAVNPYFKQEDFANNIKSLVDQGISFDLKQRAFLMTIQEKIATTFEVADGTLLRLVRIQQEDSTAGRLGMESALNSFLNNMYENTEYLKTVADGVRGSLEEMQALMQGAEATEVEFQVQKWLGSLYSVGMSQGAVQGLSGALGQIAAGQIEGLNSGAGNLLIMAANDAGLSISDILTGGINSEDTNKLLQAAVNYLAELSDSAKDNRVVQQQLANVFGVKASDLRAATNLVLPGTTNSIYGSSMTYGNMLSQLYSMAGSMGSRTSMAEMMTNIWKNGEYSLAGSMASNPVSYFIYKMAKVLDDAAGGIDLPFINVMGYGIDLNTTVSDLMRVAAVGTGILGSIGPMISGLGSSFSGQAMLNKLGISNGSGLAATPRGGDSLLIDPANRERSVSESGHVGNANASDIKDSTLQEAEDSKRKQMIEAKEEEEANKVDILNNAVVNIYELLYDVAHGNSSLKVKVEGYGLTKAGSSGLGSGAQGGVAALNSANGGGSFSGVGVTSAGLGGNVDIGGWVMNL